jgi:hypothetical protein
MGFESWSVRRLIARLKVLHFALEIALGLLIYRLAKLEPRRPEIVYAFSYSILH